MASGPWDNVQLAGPPNGPAWVNAAAQMMGATGNAVGGAFDAYQQGQKFQQQQQLFPYQLAQAQRQNNLANLFQGGVPQLPNGQVDYNSVFKSMLKAGGAPEVGTAIQALPAFQKQQLIDSYLGNNSGNQQPVSTGPATNSSASSPENIHGNFSQPRIPVSQPNNFGTGSDEGPDTVRSLVAGLAGGKPISTATINNYAKSLGVSPDADLTEDQAERAQRIISNSLAKQGVSAPTPNRGGTSPVAQSGQSDQEAQKASGGNEIPSRMGEGSSAMSPRQTTGQGKTRSAATPPGAIANDGLEDRRNVRTAQRARQPEPEPPRNFVTEGGAAKMVPPQWRGDPHAFADFLRSRAAELTSGKGGKVGDLLGVPASRDVETAKAWNTQADKIDEQLAKDNESRRKPQIEADTKYYDSLHRGLTGTAMIAAQQKQNIDMLRQVAASPNFTPGAGSDIALAYQRWMAQLGIDPRGAAPREIFNQVSTRILADQISGLKSMASETGETGARVFKQMIDLEEKANLTHENSLEGIKSQLDILDRVGDLMMKWANKADDYKIRNGSLDAGFDKELRSDIAKARLPNIIPQKPPAAGAPPVGFTSQGYRFKGGDHRDRKNWESVTSGDRT